MLGISVRRKTTRTGVERLAPHSSQSGGASPDHWIREEKQLLGELR
jgi:hypothetical protein